MSIFPTCKICGWSYYNLEENMICDNCSKKEREMKWTGRKGEFYNMLCRECGQDFSIDQGGKFSYDKIMCPYCGNTEPKHRCDCWVTKEALRVKISEIQSHMRAISDKGETLLGLLK